MDIREIVPSEIYTIDDNEYDNVSLEKKLLASVKKHTASEYNKVIAKETDYKITEALSHLRANCIEWLPIGENDSVCEIGSGYGAITEFLCERAKHVTAIELEEEKNLVNRARNQRAKNLTCITGSFDEATKEFTEQFDYILLIGSLECLARYRKEQQSYPDMLAAISAHLKPQGKLVIATANKFGLKYFAGCREAHSKQFFDSLEDNDKNVHLFTKKSLEETLHASGLPYTEVYYPYPDYQYAMSIFSDEYLPQPGDIINVAYNWDKDRLKLFDEAKVYDNIVKEGMFAEFANSFVVVASREAIVREKKKIFVKYSNDRIDYCRIKTEILQDADNKRYVRKLAMSRFAEKHMENMEQSYQMLQNMYGKTGVKMNVCKKIPGGLDFEFLTGTPLVTYLKEALEQNKEADFFDLIGKLKGILEEASQGYFVTSKKFKDIFGDAELPGNLKATGSISNIDLIFQNILIDEQGVWNVIDYEWSYPCSVPIHYILFRSVFYLFRSGILASACKDPGMQDRVYEYLHITKEEQREYYKMELKFQKYIVGQFVPLRQLKQTENIELHGKTVTVFYDKGEGFQAEDRIVTDTHVDCYGDATILLEVGAGVRRLRIDPVEHACVVKCQVKINDKELRLKHNGRKLRKGFIFFEHNDPQIYVDMPSENGGKAEITVTVMNLNDKVKEDCFAIFGKGNRIRYYAGLVKRKFFS